MWYFFLNKTKISHKNFNILPINDKELNFDDILTYVYTLLNTFLLFLLPCI